VATSLSLCAHFHTNSTFYAPPAISLTVSNLHAYAHFFGKPLCAHTDIFVNVGYDLLVGGIGRGIGRDMRRRSLLLKSPHLAESAPTAAHSTADARAHTLGTVRNGIWIDRMFGWTFVPRTSTSADQAHLLRTFGRSSQKVGPSRDERCDSRAIGSKYQPANGYDSGRRYPDLASRTLREMKRISGFVLETLARRSRQICVGATPERKEMECARARCGARVCSALNLVDNGHKN
jgi:hypothetical protein